MSFKKDIAEEITKEIIPTKTKVTIEVQEPGVDDDGYTFNYWLSCIRVKLFSSINYYIGECTLTAYPECCGACIIHNLLVIPSFRRQGCGEILLKIMEAIAKERDYSVMHGIIAVDRNSIALPFSMSFFTKHGFKIAKVRKVRNGNTGNYLYPIQKELK
jgi:GNAT superfamily N-acetyltransferase